MKIVVIKTFAQLKRALKVGQRFKVVKHYYHPQYTGQIREVSEVHSNHIFSKVIEGPYMSVNDYNFGKGIKCDFDKAVNWKFDEETGIITNLNVWTPYNENEPKIEKRQHQSNRRVEEDLWIKNGRKFKLLCAI